MKDPRPLDRSLFLELDALRRQVQQLVARRPTAQSPIRPDAAQVGAGGQWYDQTTSRPLFSDGTIWRYADGTPA